MVFIYKNFKFVLILFLILFGGGIMAVIDGFDFNENKTGIIYQENDNIVLSEVKNIHNQPINYNLEESYLHYLPVKKTGFLENYVTPPLKIDFEGSTQVEYINPFEEQVIKINDINNVNIIKFELLDTKHNAIFNWNIKTNENLPFLRYYNDENRLVYDFTDIEEINSIGNTIMVHSSVFTDIIDGVLGMVDMFYTGFQKLFTVDNVETIREAIKIKIPVPIFPWIGN